MLKWIKLQRSGRVFGSVASIAALILLSGCGRDPKALPAGLNRFPEQLSNPSLQLSGVFQDGWVAQTAALNLAQPKGKQMLAIKGMVPQVDSGQFRTEVQVSMDGRPVARESLGLGEFALQIPAVTPPGKHRVALSFSKPQRLPGADGRDVGAKLSLIGFEPPPAKRPAGAEIVRQGSGIRLGGGWGELETFNNETFRWVANDAQLLVMAPQSGSRRLTITAEPGPGVGGQPFLLKVTDASGRQMNVAEFSKRGSADVFVSAEADKETEFRLHVDGGGKPAPKDPRILNFRVFEIEAQ